MAQVPHKQAIIGGVVAPPTAATAGPDKIAWSERVALLVENDNAAAVVVTVVVPGNTKFGQANPDVPSVAIPAGQMGLIGPFPKELADPTTGLIDITAAPFATVSFYAVAV